MSGRFYGSDAIISLWCNQTKGAFHWVLAADTRRIVVITAIHNLQNTEPYLEENKLLWQFQKKK